MNFILITLPRLINSWILAPLMTYVVGPSMFILPGAVKEHFSGNALRLLSFLFLVILLNGTVRFIFSMLRKVIISWGFLPTNLTEKFIAGLSNVPLFGRLIAFLRNPAFITELKDIGYRQGYNDGFNRADSKIQEHDRHENPLRKLSLKVRDFILPLLYLFVSIEMILAVYVAM